MMENATEFRNERVQSTRPVGQLQTNRGLVKYILLTIVTFGIYHLVFMSSISNDINIVACRYDGRKTMHYCLLAFVIGPLTLGIGYFVWYHKISNRIGKEIQRRNVDYKFSAADFWLWNVLGVLILVGPWVYIYKLAKAMNCLNATYNVTG